MTKKLLAVTAFAALIAFTGCGPKPDVVATVGRETITMDEYKDALMNKFRTEENIQRQSLENREKVVQEIAINDAKYQEALARKLDQRPEVKAQLEDMAKHKALDYLYDEKVINAVVTDARVRDFYDKSAQEVRARHILLKTTPVDTAKALDSMRVKTRMDSIKQAIEKGLDFKTAAKMFSEDVTSAADSGELGWFPWGRMVDEFQEAAWKAKPEELVGPVRTAFGYHLILVEEKRPVQNRKAFSEEKERIKSQLKEAEGPKMGEVAREYVAKLREQRGLKYNEETLAMFRKKVSDPTVTKTIPLDPVFTEEEKKMVAATYDKGTVTVDSLIKKLGANAHRVPWDDPQSVRDLTNAIVEPKFLQDQAEKEGLVKKAMEDKDIQNQKRQAVIRILEREEVTDKVNPTPEDERNWYQNHLSNYIQQEQRTVREIFIKENPDLAAKVQARAAKGENFTRLALKFNQKESTEADTGRLGPYERRQFGLIGNAVFALAKLGDVSDVIPSGKNFSIVQLLNIIPSRTKTFDESQSQASREVKIAQTEEAQKALEKMVLDRFPPKIYTDKLNRVFPMLPAAAKPDTAKKG